MAYQEFLNVATGTKAQLEACQNALDRFKGDVPQEIDNLSDLLEQAIQACDSIIFAAKSEEPEA